MTDGRRDQRPFNIVQQYLPGLILSTILNTVKEMGDPYRAKPGLGGMTAYPPKAMAVVCILMETEARTYRKMVDHLRMSRGLAMKIGLPRIPSKSTIWALFIFGDLEHLVFESELYGSCPESCGTGCSKVSS